MEKEQKMNGFTLLGILIAIAVIALVGGGGLYLRETQQQKAIEQIGIEKMKEAEALKQKIEQQQKQIQAALTETTPPVASATPTIDTSNWKTYRNEKYGFEVRYPKNWEIVPTESPMLPLILSTLPDGSPLNFTLEVLVQLNFDRLSAEEFVRKVMADSHKEFQEKQTNIDLSKVQNKAVFVNGLPGYELNNVFEFDQRTERIFITEGYNAYIIRFPIAQENPNLSDPIKNNAIAHQILSTFKFTK